MAGKSTNFGVDTRGAGEAPLDVTVIDADYRPIELDARDNRDGTYDFDYTPEKGNKHTVQVGNIVQNFMRWWICKYPSIHCNKYP